MTRTKIVTNTMISKDTNLNGLLSNTIFGCRLSSSFLILAFNMIFSYILYLHWKEISKQQKNYLPYWFSSSNVLLALIDFYLFPLKQWPHWFLHSQKTCKHKGEYLFLGAPHVTLGFMTQSLYQRVHLNLLLVDCQKRIAHHDLHVSSKTNMWQ